MNILFVNMYYYPNIMGGAERSLQLLAETLVRRGHSVSVYTLDGATCSSLSSPEDINGVTVYRGYSKAIYERRILGNKKPLYKILNGLHSVRNPAANADLKVVFDAARPDVVHTNNPVSISYWIWKYARARGARVVHTLRDYWLLDPTTVLGRSPGWFTTLFRAYTRRLSRSVDFVTAPSAYVLNEFSSRGYFPSSSANVVVNAVDVDLELLESCRAAHAARSGGPVVFLYAGQLTPAKGVDGLLSTFASLASPDVRLVVCGAGELESLVKETAAADPRVSFLGKLTSEELAAEYNKADVVVVPSQWAEPFGRIVIEAAQYAVPCIGTDRGGIPEIIRTLQCGEVYAAEDWDALRSLLEKFTDREVIASQIKALPHTLPAYSLDTQAAAFERIYEA